MLRSENGRLGVGQASCLVSVEGRRTVETDAGMLEMIGGRASCCWVAIPWTRTPTRAGQRPLAMIICRGG